MYTKYMACLLSGLLLTSQATPCMATTNEPKATECIQQNQWKGKKVAFLGDSITDKIHVGTTKITGSIWPRCWESNRWYTVSTAISGTVS